MLKKKILFVYSNMGDGGTQKQKSILSRELSNRYDLSIALFKNDQLHKFHGKIIDLNAPSSGNPFRIFRRSIKRIILLKKLFKSGEYNIVISSSVISNFFSLLVKYIFKIDIPIIITFNNANKLKSEDMGIAGLFMKKFNRTLAGFADKIVTVSKSLEAELAGEGYPKNKLTTIYNGLDIERIRNLSRENIEFKYSDIFSNKVFKIIFAGRLTRQKDCPTLLKAFKIVRDNIESKLIILGDGELRKELLDEAEKLNIQQDVHLLGWVKNPYKFLFRSDLFVLSSVWEGFPNVILEAFGCGLPVISTDCRTGPGEIIESSHNGFLVPVKDHIILSEKILSIAKNKKLYKRISREGKKRLYNFDIKKVSLQWDQLIQKIV